MSSIIAKAWFLIIVFPLLEEGALGEYAFVVSIGVIAGRFLAAGLDVELPLFIRGRRKQARRCLPVYAASLGFVVLSLTFLSIDRGSNSAILVLSLAYGSHFVLAGIVQSVKPAALEILGNLHSVVFAIIVSAPVFREGFELALIAAASLLITQLLTLQVIMGKAFSRWPGSTIEMSEVVAISRRAASKLATNLTFTASMRGIVIWPKVLLGLNTSDTFGFAVTAGETLYQFGMVIVNRSYARFCARNYPKAEVFSEALGRGVALCVLFLASGLAAALLVPKVIHHFDVNWVHVGILFVMYGPLCLVQLIRYAVWAVDQKAAGFVGIFLAWNFLQIGAVVTFDSEYWPIGMTVSAAFAMVGSMLYAWRGITERDEGVVGVRRSWRRDR